MGYCTDVFTDAALKFIAADSKKPFFAYVAFNAPHAPYQVPEELAKPYAKLDLTAAGFPKLGQPWAAAKLNTDEIAKAYGMIENIDANFGRMMKALDDATLADNTIVIFLTDNGPGGVRWNAGLRNRKGTVYEGGIRVPCYVRWPAQVKGGRAIDVPLAHIDITPTLIEACQVELDGKQPGFDGRSFSRMLTNTPSNWPGRTLCFQWHRGDEPEKFRAFAARGSRYKLVQAAGVQPNAKWQPKYELFDIAADPFEERELAAEKPEEVAQLKREYELWFAEVTKKGFAPPRIVIGNEKENPVRLSRQDWRGPKAGWAADSEGHWEINFAREGHYQVTIRSRVLFTELTYEFSGDENVRGKLVETLDKATHTVTRKKLVVGPGNANLEVRIKSDGKKRGPDYVELEYLGPLEKK